METKRGEKNKERYKLHVLRNITLNIFLMFDLTLFIKIMTNFLSKRFKIIYCPPKLKKEKIIMQNYKETSLCGTSRDPSEVI